MVVDLTNNPDPNRSFFIAELDSLHSDRYGYKHKQIESESPENLPFTEK